MDKKGRSSYVDSGMKGISYHLKCSLNDSGDWRSSSSIKFTFSVWSCAYDGMTLFLKPSWYNCLCFRQSFPYASKLERLSTANLRGGKLDDHFTGIEIYYNSTIGSTGRSEYMLDRFSRNISASSILCRTIIFMFIVFKPRIVPAVAKH